MTRQINNLNEEISRWAFEIIFKRNRLRSKKSYLFCSDRPGHGLSGSPNHPSAGESKKTPDRTVRGTGIYRLAR